MKGLIQWTDIPFLATIAFALVMSVINLIRVLWPPQKPTRLAEYLREFNRKPRK